MTTEQDDLDAARWRWFRAHWAQVLFKTEQRVYGEGAPSAVECAEVMLRPNFTRGDGPSLDEAIDLAMATFPAIDPTPANTDRPHNALRRRYLEAQADIARMLPDWERYQWIRQAYHAIRLDLEAREYGSTLTKKQAYCERIVVDEDVASTRTAHAESFDDAVDVNLDRIERNTGLSISEWSKHMRELDAQLAVAGVQARIRESTRRTIDELRTKVPDAPQRPVFTPEHARGQCVVCDALHDLNDKLGKKKEE